MMAVLDEGSSSMASSPLQFFSQKSISRAAPAAVGCPWPPEMKSDERGIFLVHLLLNCANYVAAGDLENADACLEHISLLGASPDGDTMQRLAAVFADALARRLLRASWPGVFRAITAGGGGAAAASSFQARRHFFELCPFLKLAYLIATQAVLEAMEGELVVHVVDLHAGDPAPWVVLLQALSTRPGGAPHLRITGVHDQKQVLDLVAARLSEEAEKLDVPFQFNPIVSKLEGLDPERSLPIKSGEAVAVCSVLQLHRLLAHRTKTEEFLAALRRLGPKLTVVVEQESDHSGGTLAERFTEALNYYAALFDCLESASAAAGARPEERARVERALLGEEVRALIGGEERHERMDRWVRRMEAAGFRRAPLSPLTLMQARRLLQQGYGGAAGGYGVREEGGGCHALCWQERALFSVSAWACRRFDGC